jgi:hypothetical protein
VDIPKKDAEGNAIRDEASEEVREVLLEVDEDADNPKKAKKAAAAIESLIRKHRTEESYKRIKQVIRPNSGVHLKTLTYDLTRILRTSLIMFDNDATGCFDRIIALQ